MLRTMTRNNDVTEFGRRWSEMSGYVYPQYEYLAEKDPDFAESFFGIMKSWRREGAIPLQYKEMMILMGSCIKMQDMAVRTHLRRARELGATHDELLELCELVLLSGGGVAMVKALGALMESFGEGGSAPTSPDWGKPSEQT